MNAVLVIKSGLPELKFKIVRLFPAEHKRVMLQLVIVFLASGNFELKPNWCEAL